ncbi:hypothetical protein HK405_008185, partial [Cladochytrium tenue]
MTRPTSGMFRRLASGSAVSWQRAAAAGGRPRWPLPPTGASALRPPRCYPSALHAPFVTPACSRAAYSSFASAAASARPLDPAAARSLANQSTMYYVASVIVTF